MSKSWSFARLRLCSHRMNVQNNERETKPITIKNVNVCILYVPHAHNATALH